MSKQIVPIAFMAGKEISEHTVRGIASADVPSFVVPVVVSVYDKVVHSEDEGQLRSTERKNRVKGQF